MDLYTFFKVVLRNWWLITLAVLITAGSAAYALSQREPVYQAIARVVLKPSPLLTDPNLQINAHNALERRTLINTLAQIAQTSAMYERVGNSLNTTPGAVQATELRAIVVPDANLIEIYGRSTDATLAAQVVNVVAAELSKEVPQQTFRMDIIDPAVVPSVPVGPQPVRTVTLAVVFGLVLGVSLTLLGYFAQGMHVTSNERGLDENNGFLTLQGAPDHPETESSAQTQPLFTR